MLGFSLFKNIHKFHGFRKTTNIYFISIRVCLLYFIFCVKLDNHSILAQNEDIPYAQEEYDLLAQEKGLHLAQ